MRSEIGPARAVANAVLVLAILVLGGFATVQVARRHWQWQSTFHARAEFASVGGLEAGDRVRVQGVNAGVVEAILPPAGPGRPVQVVLRIDAKLRSLIRADAVARIATQGVVGAKVVEIVPGRPDALALSDSGVLKAEPPIEVADLLRNASESLHRLDLATAAAREGVGEVNAIASNIRQGKGSLGKLVQDDEAYRKLVTLSDKGEKTLHDLEENLAALKRTWPLSRYFHNRAFFDRDRLLFQPGAERESQSLSEADLFEPGRAVLTAQGRRKLDEVGAWFRKISRRNSEVVIAAFTDDTRDEDLAQILTQEQAESVRKYLVTRYAIDSAGWFGTRKVAAVGFGTQVPHELGGEPRDMPARRVEIILFTPQT